MPKIYVHNLCLLGHEKDDEEPGGRDEGGGGGLVLHCRPDYDNKNSSIAGQAPRHDVTSNSSEYSHKPWNSHG